MIYDCVFFIKVYISWYHTISFKKEAMKLYSQRHVEIYCNFVFNFDRKVLAVCVRAYLLQSPSFGNHDIKNIKIMKVSKTTTVIKYRILNSMQHFCWKYIFCKYFALFWQTSQDRVTAESLSLLGFSFVWVGLQSDEEERMDEQEGCLSSEIY